MNEQVFLSYRRSNGSEKTRLLKLFLEESGYTVFMDQDRINRSMPFPDELKRRICECTDYILVVTNGSLSYKQGGTDYLFEEMLQAYSCYMENGTPLLHVVAESEINTTKFGNVCMDDVPAEYEEALEHFCKLTPLPIANFSGSDEEIINRIRTAVKRDFVSQPKVNTMKQLDGPSGYNVDEKEMERLAKQGETAYQQDDDILEDIFSKIRTRHRGGLTVLDVGCANGKTGKKYFGNKVRVSKVVGIDKNEKLICKALEEEQSRSKTGRGQKFFYKQLDVSSKNFDVELERIKNELKIENFDVIFCCQVLHHIANPQEILKKLSKHLYEGGCVIVRASDDGSKMVYCPGYDEENKRIIQDIVDLTVSLPRMADRFYGRRLFSELKLAEFGGVRVTPVYSVSSTFPREERESFLTDAFKESFSWRYEIFQDKDGITPGEYIISEQQMKAKLDKLQEMFRNLLCWYCSIDYFAYGFKKSN